MRAHWFPVVALAAGITACGSTEGPPIASGAGVSEPLATAFTNRLAASDPVTQAVVLSQAVYPVTREENGPGAVILTRTDAVDAFTAMSRVTHMPVNAPLLYINADGTLPQGTRRELRRLRPDGVVQDRQTQVYVVGRLDPELAAVTAEAVRELNYRVRVLIAPDPFALSELLDRWQAALKSDHEDEVIVSALSDEGMAHGLGAMGWNAHMGKGFAWVTRDEVPAATRQILRRRLGGAYIYIMGGEAVISSAVARELARYGVVRRIQGPDVYATNAVFAGYKDFGRNFGWWWSESPRALGWGIAQAGHNFIIGSRDDLLGMIPAAVLGHMGKHGPILLVDRDRVPQAVSDYLRMVQPDAIAAPDKSILNFAWVIGEEQQVSWEVQQQLTRLLAPAGGESAAAVSQVREKR